MKTLLFIALFSAAFLAYPDMSAIKTAIKKGDVTTLEKHLSSKVELAIDGKDDIYSKDKAAALIRTFFSSNKPKNFNEMHQGASKGKASHYLIGVLSTNAKNYQVTIMLEDNGGGYLIQELRFDEN